MIRNSYYATKSVKKLRRLQNITQGDLVEILSVVLSKNVSISLYQKWEQGQRAVSRDTAMKITQELGGEFKELWTIKQTSSQ